MKAVLSKKYQVSGIPTLIVLDGKTGKLITKDGRSIITDDPEGSDFPWSPKSLAEEMKDAELQSKDGKTSWNDVKKNVVGLYFSAHWVRGLCVLRPLYL